jgi:hypothetical protein
MQHFSIRLVYLHRVNNALCSPERNSSFSNTLLHILEHEDLYLVLHISDHVQQNIPCCLCPPSQEVVHHGLRGGGDVGGGGVGGCGGHIQLVAGGVQEADVQEQLVRRG